MQSNFTWGKDEGSGLAGDSAGIRVDQLNYAFSTSVLFSS